MRSWANGWQFFSCHAIGDCLGDCDTDFGVCCEDRVRRHDEAGGFFFCVPRGKVSNCVRVGRVRVRETSEVRRAGVYDGGREPAALFDEIESVPVDMVLTHEKCLSAGAVRDCAVLEEHALAWMFGFDEFLKRYDVSGESVVGSVPCGCGAGGVDALGGLSFSGG